MDFCELNKQRNAFQGVEGKSREEEDDIKNHKITMVIMYKDMLS